MGYNRILTDVDREQYAPIIQEMHDRVPDMTARKIYDALVQQAFVVDTIRKLIPRGRHILSAGGYEDTAGALLAFDYDVFTVDPALNWTLHDFKSIHTQPFDAIISTSVLEHVPDDQTFVEDCCYYLKPNGIAVFTMDFLQDWQNDDRLPSTSYRFYRKADLCIRLYKILRNNNCELLGDTDYGKTDIFSWEGISYSFSTWCFKKGV